MELVTKLDDWSKNFWLKIIFSQKSLFYSLLALSIKVEKSDYGEVGPFSEIFP